MVILCTLGLTFISQSVKPGSMFTLKVNIDQKQLRGGNVDSTVIKMSGQAQKQELKQSLWREGHCFLTVSNSGSTSFLILLRSHQPKADATHIGQDNLSDITTGSLVQAVTFPLPR